MPPLPIIQHREDDEILYSWILRLAHANGFELARPFVNAYITPNATISEQSRRVLKYDLLEDYENICRVLALRTDKQELFLESGIFPYYSIMMTSDQQSAILDAAFNNNTNDNVASVTSTKMTSELRLCPECMKEDEAKRVHFYYHRIHQLPGVTVCAKHGCALRVYTGKQMHELDQNPMTVEMKPDKDALHFAQYSADLLKADIDADASTLKRLILNKLKEFGITTFEKFQSVFIRDKCPGGFDVHVKLLWRKIHSEEYLDPVPTVKLLMELFPNVDQLKNCFNTSCPSESFEKALIQQNCTLVSKYRNSIVELKHECGWIFSINPKEFISAWACPYCTPNDVSVVLPHKELVSERTEKMFVQEIADLTGDEYTLIGPYVKMNEPVEIRHNVCGRIQKYKPAAFLDGSRCKYCNEMMRENQFFQLVESLSGGRYKIVSKRSNNLYTIKDTKTGFSRDMTSKKILQELRRPTPSALLPKDKSGTEINIKSQIKDVRTWVEQNCPRGLPIFLEDITIDGLDYAVIKNRLRDLYVKKHIIKPICPGIYEHAEDNLSNDAVVRARYLVRNGQHIGYPAGRNALYYLGILKAKPEEYQVVTNKETSTNLNGRTTKFLGHKLRIRGSSVEINDDNWKVLMVLNTVVNLHKYIKPDERNEAYQILADYVHKNGITPEDFSRYQQYYAFSYNAVRKLYKEEYAQANIT